MRLLGDPAHGVQTSFGGLNGELQGLLNVLWIWLYSDRPSPKLRSGRSGEVT